MFAFDFAALDYRSTTNHQYAYKLEGFDQDWIHIGSQRTATYTNIEAGRYVFTVKAANKDGVWNENGVAIEIEIVPPLWQTWWAYIGYVLVLILMFYMVVKYRDLHTTTNIYRILSVTDQLTGITNRTGMLNIIDEVFVDKKIHTSVGLLVIDIDHFKLINDTRGHDVGDRVLREFSALIAKHIRADDKFARWGGEEFVVLTFQADQRGLITFAEKLRTVVVNHVFEKDAEPLTVTTSIGVAWVKPDESFESVFKRADLALYEAKATTRNRVVVAE
jgi:diguanylate cyclase (GGDEF)-like protein